MSITKPAADCSLTERAGVILNHWLYYCPLPPRECLWLTANQLGEVRLRGVVGSDYPLSEVIRCLQGVPGVHCVLNDVAIIFRGSVSQ